MLGYAARCVPRRAWRALRSLERHVGRPWLVLPQTEAAPSRGTWLARSARMNEITRRLATDHAELEALLAEISNATERGAFDVLQRAWSELERALTGHHQAEERYLLSLIEAAHPAEARAIWAEHRLICGLVAELGVEVELRTISADDVKGLIRTLREHSRTEGRTLYRWAGDSASTQVERLVVAMLSTAQRGAQRERAEEPRAER